MPLSPYVVVATCKTEACGNTIALGRREKHAGPVDSTSPTTSEFLYKCGKCGKTHTYREQDARIEQMAEPSPARWLSIW